MRSFVSKIAGAAAVFAGAATAQEFRVVGSVYTGTPGEIYTYRTWYGDSNLYVGPRVPASVENALNFTSESLPSSRSYHPSPMNGDGH